MAQVIASVEIELYDDGTYEVSKDSEQGVEDESKEPQGQRAQSIDEALSMAKDMLGASGTTGQALAPTTPAMPAKTPRAMPGAISMR